MSDVIHESTGEVVAVGSNNVRNEVAGLSTGKATSVYSSIKGEDFASRKKTLAAVTDSEAIRDNLGKVINLQNFVIQVTQMENEQTGALEDVPRVILIDDKGKSYHAISSVLMSDLQNFVGLLGEPHEWDEPIKVKVVEQQSGAKRRFMTLTMV